MTIENTGSQQIPSRSSSLDEEKTVISQRPAVSPREFFQQMPLAELAVTLEGKMLDHFLVVQLIGGGGMGAVFRGQDKRLDRVVAIKVIPAAKRDPAMLRRFRLEAQAAARLDHPNIARVYYVGDADQWDYIVFEYIDGINVRDLVDMDGPLSVDDAVFYTRQIAEALQHAHEREVVHRDIKPSNILVTATGTAKLVDMGLARDTSSEKSTQDRTASGVTLGSFDYISPEQAKNPRDADVRSDLYSLGCSLFFMLTGHPPFPEGTALQKLLNHGSLPPPDPRGWRDDLPDELCQIMMKLMAKRPSDRYQKPVELVNDLLLLAELEGLPRSQSPNTLTLIPTIAQPTLLETYLPWLVAAGALFGSTLWLHSQMKASGFALPPVEYPTVSASSSPSQPSSFPESPLTSVPASSIPAGLSSGSNESAQTLASNFQTPQTATEKSIDSRAISSQVHLTPNQSLESLIGNNGAAGSNEAPQSFPLPAFALPSSSGSALTTASGTALPNSSGATPSVNNSQGVIREPNPIGLNGSANTAGDRALAGSELSKEETFEAESAGRRNGPQSARIFSGVSAEPGHSTIRNSSIRSTTSPDLHSTNDSMAQLPVIVVSNNPPSDISSQFWESSLQRAVQRLSEISDSGIIEVHGSVWLDRPLDIGAKRLSKSSGNRQLIIRGGKNSEARIEVARGVWSNMPEGTGVMRVGGAQLSLQNIQLQAVLNDTESVPRSLIQLKGYSIFEAIGCTFTVQRERPYLAHLISINDIDLDRSTMAGSSSDIQPVQVALSQCFVRGDTSLIKIGQTGPAARHTIQISVDDSLIAVNGRAIDLVSSTGPEGIDRIVRVFCEQSTFICSAGFARLDYEGLELPLIGLSRTSKACVFWSRQTVPHVSITGESIGLKDNPDLLFLQGVNNAYDQQTQTLCQTMRSGQQSEDISFRVGSQSGWFVERGNERAVSWLKPVQSDSGFHSMNASDFALIPNHFVPGFQSTPSTQMKPPN